MLFSQAGKTTLAIVFGVLLAVLNLTIALGLGCGALFNS